MEGSKRHSAERITQSLSAGLVIRQKEPSNLEMPFNYVDSYLTPTELFLRTQSLSGTADRIRPLSVEHRWSGQQRRPLRAPIVLLGRRRWRIRTWLVGTSAERMKQNQGGQHVEGMGKSQRKSNDAHRITQLCALPRFNVDQDADCQGEPTERHCIERMAEEVQHDDRCQTVRRAPTPRASGRPIRLPRGGTEPPALSCCVDQARGDRGCLSRRSATTSWRQRKSYSGKWCVYRELHPCCLLNVSDDGRAGMPHFEAVGFAVQVEQPT
jgi:hypothetical protein